MLPKLFYNIIFDIRMRPDITFAFYVQLSVIFLYQNLDQYPFAPVIALVTKDPP